MKKVIVTGTSGFVGTTMVERFHEKYRLVGLDRVPPKERWPGVEYRVCDILEREALARIIMEVDPDAIVHLAARARVQDGEKDPVGTYRVNVEGTINVLEAAARCSAVEKVIVISSEQVYGVVERFPTPEELGPGKPQNAYAASKAAADLLAQRFPCVPVVVARSAMGCGPRSSPVEQVTSRFVKNVLDGKPLRFPAENVVHPTRDVSPAWNFVGGLGLILDHADASGVYNLGSGKEISILDLAKTVTRELGAGEIMMDPSFHYREGEEGFRTCLDTSRARKELGYEPEVSLEQAIELTAAWMSAVPDYFSRRSSPPRAAWSKER